MASVHTHAFDVAPGATIQIDVSVPVEVAEGPAGRVTVELHSPDHREHWEVTYVPRRNMVMVEGASADRTSVVQSAVATGGSVVYQAGGSIGRGPVMSVGLRVRVIAPPGAAIERY